MEKALSCIFGSEAKVRIMRSFIFNPTASVPVAEISKRTKTRSNVTRKELNGLLKAGFVKKRGKNYSLNTSYRYFGAISHFLTASSPLSEKELVRRLSPAGSIKLILISGVLMHVSDSRADILIVGDNIKHNKLLTVMSSIEAELGRELRYAVFETSDFQYRLGIYDKLIRDILDSQHEKILNKLGLPTLPTVMSISEAV